MSFDIKRFKNNILFFVLCMVAIIAIIVISLFSNKKIKLDEEELTNDESIIGSLVINEIMTSNKGAYADPYGKLYDYVEIYNGSNKKINLKNYGLSDVNTEIKYTFPNIEIKPKEYIVIFLSGNSKSNYHAPFKLKSSGGETLALFRHDGKIIDAVQTVDLQKNTVMARNAEGKWIIQKEATPGFANTIDGHKEFVQSITSIEEAKIEINEVLPNNKGNFKNKYGEYSGYIELRNKSDKKVNIENYAISNSTDAIYKWHFPSIELSPGEIVVVFTSDRNILEGEELHASFKLDSKNGIAILSNEKGKIVDKVEYENLANGMALVKQNGKMLESSILSPGEPNTIDGIKNFQKEYIKTGETLIINEVMSSNFKFLPQNGGNYYDWIELYNNSNDTIKLSDYCLTTNTNSSCMYKLPEVELKKGAYYIIIASGDSNLSNNSYNHANFKISNTESLYIMKENKIIDSLFISDLPLGASIGKSGKSGIYYYSTPTPGAANSNGLQAIAYKPASSVKSGAYNNIDALVVELYAEGTIYYTTDGSNPTTSSHVYSSPLNLKSTTVLKTMSVENGKYYSETATYNFIINENHTLPVMAVSIDPKDLKQLHRNAWTEGYEKPCNAELLELNGTGFSINAGLKLFGGSTRGHSKKSYELKFQKQYGPGKLNYHVFDDVDSSVFDSLVLRTGSQDEMGDASKKTLIRDIVGTSLVSEFTTVDVQAYKPVVMYLNGKYWGLYFIREKIDETFVANHYNVKATKSNTDLLRIDGQVKSGNKIKYNNLINFVKNNSLANPNNYNQVKEQVDIENIIDFWIAETWTANNDILNVRYFSNPDVDNGKWKFIFYDLDFAFYNVAYNYFNFATSPGGMTGNGFSTTLLSNLMKSPEFKTTYLERLSYNLRNTWHPDNVNKKIDEIIAEIGENEIRRNQERWKTTSFATWKNNINHLRSYASRRGSYMIKHAKSYFKLSNSDVKKYFGGL